MKNATLKQALKLFSVFEDTPSEKMQAILESGRLVDIRDSDLTKVSRDEFREFVELDPLTPKPQPLLEFVNSITNPGTVEKFIARGRFAINTESDAPVKISYLGDTFEGWFLDKIEEPTGRSTLYAHKLLKASADGPIIMAFGGEDEVAATLAEMFHLMKQQANGEDGPLLTNRYANIFYIHDVNGVLRAVYCNWNGYGWDVDACSVRPPVEWRAGCRVFSRNRLAA